MLLSREEVQHIAKLARVGLTEDDVQRFQEQLSQILDYFQSLQQLDTTQVPPTGHAIEMQNVFRPDEVTPSFSPQDVLANAPREEEGYFRVQSVLEF